MVICGVGANDLHMVQLMPLPLRHLLLQYNPEWFTFLVLAYPGCPETRLFDGCSSCVDKVQCMVVMFTFQLIQSDAAL